MAIPRNLANIAPHVNASSTELVVNDGGANLDFRVEGDTNANLLVADAGAEKVGFGTNTFNTNGGVIQVSNGISFPATQSACSDVNTLDDYEEGTWEPDIRPATGSFTSVTYSADNGGYYIKIGRLLYLTGTVRWTAINTAGGSDRVHIGNLPFTTASRSDGDNADAPGSVMTIQWTGGADANKVPQIVQTPSNDTFLRLATQDKNAILSYIEVPDIGSSCTLTFAVLGYTNS